MFDDLTEKEKGYSDDFEPDTLDIMLIVKHNFHVMSENGDKFLFVPTGSSLKFIRCTSSLMPYYELKTYVIYLECQGKEMIINGSQIINSNNDLKLRNCTSSVKDGKPYLEVNNTLKWEDVFVQRFKSIIKV